MHETVKQFIFKIKIISSVYLMQYVFNLLFEMSGRISNNDNNNNNRLYLKRVKQ